MQTVRVALTEQLQPTWFAVITGVPEGPGQPLANGRGQYGQRNVIRGQQSRRAGAASTTWHSGGGRGGGGGGGGPVAGSENSVGWGLDGRGGGEQKLVNRGVDKLVGVAGGGTRPMGTSQALPAGPPAARLGAELRAGTSEHTRDTATVGFLATALHTLRVLFLCCAAGAGQASSCRPKSPADLLPQVGGSALAGAMDVVKARS